MTSPADAGDDGTGGLPTSFRTRAPRVPRSAAGPTAAQEMS